MVGRRIWRRVWFCGRCGRVKDFVLGRIPGRCVCGRIVELNLAALLHFYFD